MIQELFGGNLNNHTAVGGLGVAEKEPSPHSTGVLQPPHASSPLPSSSTSTTTTTNPKPSSETLNPLRCPRCDSSNTKFCYYNNYNLTQPRHFCKTCRRYWTKGGALRNVPIGGGCRKNNKNNMSHAISSSLEKPCTAKLIRSHLLSSENMGNASSGYLGGFDHPGGLSTNSLQWTSPQTSQLLALLRSNQTQNPNPNFNYSFINSVKEEGFLNGSGGLQLDPNDNNQLSSFWRNNERPRAELQQQSGGLVLQNLSNQDQLCNIQRASFKSAENYYCDNYAPALLMGNGHAPSPNCSDILDSTPVVGGGQLVGCLNNISLSRPDLPTTNGAYH